MNVQIMEQPIIKIYDLGDKKYQVNIREDISKEEEFNIMRNMHETKDYKIIQEKKE